MSNVMVQVVRALVMILVMKVMLRRLGDEGYGVWVTVGSVLGYGGFLDFGVTRAVGRYLARYVGRGDMRRYNGILASGLVFFGVMGLVALALVTVLSTHIVAFFTVPAHLTDAFRLALIVGGVHLAQELPLRVFGAALNSREAFVPKNLVEGTFVLVSGAAVTITLYAGGGLVAVSVAWTLCGTAQNLVLRTVLLRLYPEIRVDLSLFRFRRLKRLLNFGAYTMLWWLADQLRHNSAPIVIGRMVDLAAVSVYRVALYPINQAHSLLGKIQAVLQPRMSSIEGAGDRKSLRALFVESSRINMLLATVGFASMIVLGGPFVCWWFGSELPDPWRPYRLLLILVPAYYTSRSQNMIIPLVYAVGRHRWMAVILLTEGLVALAAGFVLAAFRGTEGALVGLAVPTIVVSSIVLPWYGCRCVGLELKTYYLKVLLRPWTAMFMGMAVYVALVGWRSVKPWPAVSGGAIWLVLIVVLLADDFERIFRVASDRLLAAQANRGSPAGDD